MNKQALIIAKMNLANIKVPYFVTGLALGIAMVQSIIYAIIAIIYGKAGIQMEISIGNYFWLVVLLAAVYIPTRNFRRIVNLGGKRNGFFWGSMISYVLLASVGSLANAIFYYTYDKFLIGTGAYVGIGAFLKDSSMFSNKNIVVNLIELFGWNSHGVFLAIIQQFVFLILLAAVVHTLSSIQDKWYGWVIDVIIAAFLGLFIPIASLRPTLLSFINLIVFNSNAFVQIVICLILAILIYALNKPILSRKAI